MKILNQVDAETLFAICKEANTPYSLSIWLHFKNDQLTDLLKLQPDPINYLNAHDFAIDYFVSSFIRKNKWMRTGIDKRLIALQKFTEVERQNKLVNQRFKSRSFTLREEQLLAKMSRKISLVLGYSPPDDWTVKCGWGPGVTSTVKGEVNNGIKMREKRISVTNRALPYIQYDMSRDIHWLASRGIFADGPVCVLSNEFNVTDHNRVVLVPKDAKTDRVIAAEPTGNIFLQKGVGRIIRERLKRHGINLDDATQNQRAAKRAFSSDLATIDLSSASDSLCRELVFDVLPIDWANLLDALRSPVSLMPDGTRIVNEKFSSMGNGFTFELESLIFYAAACAVCGEYEEIYVYGDDIIIPQRHAQEFIALLNTIGFSVNNDKTYVSGNFYESCGKHYFKGFDVTPIYQKESVATLPERIRAANRLYRWHLRYFGVSIELTPILFGGTWRHLVDDCQLLLPPNSEEDSGILSSRWRTRIHKRSRRSSGYLRIIRSTFKRASMYHADALALTLRFGSISVDHQFDGTVAIRSRPLYRDGKRSVRSWDS